MNSKLTLRMDDGLIALAKAEAAQRGKSVSQMVGEFFDLLGHAKAPVEKLPPVTSSTPRDSKRIRRFRKRRIKNIFWINTSEDTR